MNMYTEDLEKSLKNAIIEYWHNPENHVIDGKKQDGLSCECRDINVNYCLIEEGKEVSQFEKLIDILLYNNSHEEHKHPLPHLYGKFSSDKIIDNGNGKQTINYKFEIYSDDYEVTNFKDIILNNITSIISN